MLYNYFALVIEIRPVAAMKIMTVAVVVVMVGGDVCCIFYFALVIETMPVTAMEIMTVTVVWWC